MVSSSLAERFWKNVHKTWNCWFWIGSRTTAGYGNGTYAMKHFYAHHAVWFLTHGIWPKYLLHTCDTPQCVNPDHLIEGNQSENNRDAARKGIKGETYFNEFCKHGHARTSENVGTDPQGKRYCKVCARIRYAKIKPTFTNQSCKYCGNQFLPRRASQKYCTSACVKLHWRYGSA